MRDLNDKLVALAMSQLRSKNYQDDVEVYAHAYFAAADITTGPRCSWITSRDIMRLSTGATSMNSPCSSTAATTTPLPDSTR
ncbi:unnamed protein product [Hydatigera taeniaeformis]|uniref:Ribonuc_red_lgN domain-containing protein n=1 Tax=Hydatigena taeniaeformis TaxID=6205 RepID=A0A0R3WTC5_HYDTA|nr:unnamed protein product [Hydatigera taeniaeformis]